jgi:uncharacterized protein (TIGR04255 family)
MPKKLRPIDRLPKAPLAEVVFELRWKLPGPEETPVWLKSDPGLSPLMDVFTAKMKKIGFGTIRDMSPQLPTVGYSIVRRFFHAPDTPFPIMQIGHGIFATNESSLYEWNSFKTQMKAGVGALLESYPRLGILALHPAYLELRYIDVFDKSLLGKAALFDFLERGTTMKIALPKTLKDGGRFSGEANGRLLVGRQLKGWKQSQFLVDISTGKRDGAEDIVRLETKVVTEGAWVPTLKSHPKFIRDVDNWAEFAHSITSPFFKDFVAPEVMQQFG